MPEQEMDSSKENTTPGGPATNGKLHKTVPKPSRIPIPSKPRPPLIAVQCQSQDLPTSSTSSSKLSSSRSCVKEVPDFGKLHKQFHQQLEKKKQKNRMPTQIQEFALTPVSKFSAKKHRGQSRGREKDPPCTPFGKSSNNADTTKQLRVEEEEGGRVEEGGRDPGSPFKVNPTSLLAILNEQSIPTQPCVSHRQTMATPGRPGLRDTLTLPSDITLFPRYSMCSSHRFQRTIQAKEKSVVDQFKELCARKVQTTIQSTRSIAKVDVDSVGGGRMRDIKLNLDAQLSQVADPPVAVKTPQITRTMSACSLAPPPTTPGHTRPVLLLATTPSATQTHRDLKTTTSVTFTAGAKLFADLEQMTIIIAPRSHFYEVDTEVCGILAGCRKPVGATRLPCCDPVARTLEMQESNCHFVPIADGWEYWSV